MELKNAVDRLSDFVLLGDHGPADCAGPRHAGGREAGAATDPNRRGTGRFAQQGGIVGAALAGRADATLSDGLVVYYFHGNTRCPTCRSIESQAHEVVQSDFAAELKSGAVSWKMLNYEEPAAADLAKKFEIQMPVVVLAKMQARRNRPVEAAGPCLGVGK